MVALELRLDGVFKIKVVARDLTPALPTTRLNLFVVDKIQDMTLPDPREPLSSVKPLIVLLGSTWFPPHTWFKG